MTYADEFARLLNERGIPVDAAVVPDKEFVDADVQVVREWLALLEENTRAAIDEVTAENAVQAGLGDPQVAIVGAIGPVLAAFDSQPESISITVSIDMIARASEDAGNLVS